MAAQQALPRPYLPGDDPDTPILSAVTDEMRMQALATRLGLLAGKQAALSAILAKNKAWIKANSTPERMRAIRISDDYKAAKAAIEAEVAIIRSKETVAILAALDARHKELVKSIRALDFKIYDSYERIRKIDAELEILESNIETRKEQEESRKIQELATKLGELAGKQAALTHILAQERGKLFDAMQKGPPSLPKAPSQQPNSAPPPTGSTKILSVG